MIDTNIRAYYVPYQDAIAVFIETEGKQVTALVVEDNPGPGQLRTAATHISNEAAQRLMDDLWTAGLRPVAGKQSEGVTEAQAHHLEDMRTIVFDRLKLVKP
jgi:hypothetical protein